MSGKRSLRAKVEASVLIVERYLLGRLRHRRFYSLGELNLAIQEMLVSINELRPLRRLGVTRRQLLEELDRPALKLLPAEPYVYAEWRTSERLSLTLNVRLPRWARLSYRRRRPLLQCALPLRQ